LLQLPFICPWGERVSAWWQLTQAAIGGEP
jgi:hypothetical protein